MLTTGRDLTEFGRLLHESWQVKKGLESSISNSEVDELYERGMRAGALGGKLLGAGSGGFLLFFCEPQRQQAVRRAMAGTKEIPFQFRAPGQQDYLCGRGPMELRRGAFLDRDGVINVSPEPGRYVRSWEEFHLIPEAVEWIRLFNAIEMPVIVVTNQRGVSAGARQFGRTGANPLKHARRTGAPGRACGRCVSLPARRERAATAASRVRRCSTRRRGSGSIGLETIGRAGRFLA